MVRCYAHRNVTPNSITIGSTVHGQLIPGCSARMIQWYLPWGATVQPQVIRGSMGEHESVTQTASRSTVQSFWQGIGKTDDHGRSWVGRWLGTCRRVLLANLRRSRAV